MSVRVYVSFLPSQYLQSANKLTIGLQARRELQDCMRAQVALFNMDIGVLLSHTVAEFFAVGYFAVRKNVSFG